jgi:preprotein translocase subunit YajC
MATLGAMFSSAFGILAAEDSSGGGGAAFQLVFFALIFVAMYFLLIRPQRRRARETQNLQSSISENDEVLLNSGIYGFVTAIDGDVVWVDIAENVEIRVSKSAIARRINASTEPAGGTATESDSESDK